MTFDQYQQQLLTLITSTAGDLSVIGDSGAESLALANQTLAGLTGANAVVEKPRYFDDIDSCLNADALQPSTSVFVSINAISIDKLQDYMGALCQRFPNQVLIELQHGAKEKAAAQAFRLDCFALGFRHALQSGNDSTAYQLYEYRLKNYKQAPDWLNSRFWANPERFKLIE
jgi:hypothetical protein